MSLTRCGEKRPISFAMIPSMLLGKGMILASGYFTGAVLWIRADLMFTLSRAAKPPVFDDYSRNGVVLRTFAEFDGV